MGIRGGKRAVVMAAMVGAGSLATLAAARAEVRSAAAPPGDPALRVIPFPGTPDASPDSQVMFPALSPSDVRAVSVRGSRSGTHAGHLAALPDHAGTAFEPRRPFTPGERVYVDAALSSPAAGTASGDPGSASLRYSFQIALPGASSTVTASRATHRRATNLAGTASAPRPRFHSAPGLHPPSVQVSSNPDPAAGDVFLTPKRFGHSHSLQSGLMILDSQGHLVWFRHLHAWTSTLSVQRYQGQPVLTWWQRRGNRREDVIANRSYRIIRVLHAGDGYASHLDLHDFQITPQGTAFVDANVPVRANLSSVGGPRAGRVLDCVVQELDVRTGQVLWEWHMFGHVPLGASYKPPPSGHGVYDAFHLNSIQELPDGNLLISARHTWGVYEINRLTGQVMWTLGGKRSNFKIEDSARFEWQHDARLYPGNLLTLFDDASNGHTQQEFESSAKELQLNMQTMTASLVRRFSHTPPIISASQGDAQTLSNGDLFVGWGSKPDFSEYTPSGQQIFTGRFAVGVESYRAYRFPWTGEPGTSPVLAVAPQPGGSLIIYASWNGATQVASWRVLGGSGALSPIAGGLRTGFETSVDMDSEPRDLAVQALNASGRVLGTSSAQPDPPHLAIFGSTAFVQESNGVGKVAVGCIADRSCALTTKVSQGKSVLAQSAPVPVPARQGGLLYFELSATGLHELEQSADHRLSVLVTVHSSSGGSAAKQITLVPYSTSGPAPQRSVVESPTVQVLDPTGFIAPAGSGGIESACYAPVPCRLHGTVTSHSHLIATIQPQPLGTDELGSVAFQLTPTGQQMLANSSGNQLSAQLTLTDGHDTASGQIVLIRYS